jgi:hypothetical protein
MISHSVLDAWQRRASAWQPFPDATSHDHVATLIDVEIS